MQEKISNKIQGINYILKLVSLANEQLRTRNGGKFANYEIMVNVSFLTNGYDGICKILQFTMLEKEEDEPEIEIVKGDSWSNFIEKIKYELGNRFIILTKLAEIKAIDHNNNTNFDLLLSNSNVEKDADEVADNIDDIELDMSLDEDELLDFGNDSDEDENEEDNADTYSNYDPLKDKDLKRIRDSAKKGIKKIRAEKKKR